MNAKIAALIDSELSNGYFKVYTFVIFFFRAARRRRVCIFTFDFGCNIAEMDAMIRDAAHWESVFLSPPSKS